MNKYLAILFLVVVAIFLYGATLRGEVGNAPALSIKNQLDQATRPFELSPERGRFAHTVTLVETGQYALNKSWADVVYPDVGIYGGQFFSFFAPGISYITAPVYSWASQFNLGQVFTFATISLFATLSLVVIFLICIDIFKLSKPAALLAAFVFAFSSTSWSYAITLYQHHVTTLCALLGVYAVWKFSQKSRWAATWAGLVGLTFGLAFAVDYPNAFLLLPIPLYLLFETFSVKLTENSLKVGLRLSAITTVLTLGLLLGIHAYHNQYYFGNFTKLSGSLADYKSLVEKGLDSSPSTASQQAISKIEAKKSNVINFFSEQQIPHSPTVLFFSTDRGLFVYSPIMLLAVFGMFWVLAKKPSRPTYALAGLLACNVFLYSSWGDPWGGWAYGPRYLIMSMAILSIFLAIFLTYVKSVWLKLLTFILISFSSAIALLGAITGNAVPPKIEGVYLSAKYNFLQNLDWVYQDRSGSFVYKTIMHSHLSVFEYATILYVALLCLFLVLLLVPWKGEQHAD